MTLSTDAVMDLVEVLVLALGLAITWAVFHGSERAELPGEATIPDPVAEEEIDHSSEGRTLR